MREREITIELERYELSGILNAEPNYETPVVVVCQGLMKPWDANKYELLQDCLEEKRIASLRFDLYGRISEQKGNIERRAASIGLANLTSAVDYLLKLGYERKRLGLLGASMGGHIACVYASENKVGALVLREPTYANIENKMKRVKASTLLIHGNRLKGEKLLALMGLEEQLDYLSIMGAKEFLSNFGGLAEIKFIEGADHECENPSHVKQFVQYSADWFSEHL
jgi:hypothetical protein